LFFNKKSRWTGSTTRRPGGTSVHGGPEDKMAQEFRQSVGSSRIQGHGAHCGCRKKIEGILPVLTAGFGDRGNGEVRPAVKRRRRWQWCSVSGDWGRGEERRRGAASAVQRGGGGVHFIGPGRRWGGSRRRWSFPPCWFRRS
jgi:hypothetical protein